MAWQTGKRGQSTGKGKGIDDEQERRRELGAEAGAWVVRSGVMAGLVMMACGLHEAVAGMTQRSWQGWQTLDANMSTAWWAQGAGQHDGSSGGMRAIGCWDSGACGQWEGACVGAALGRRGSGFDGQVAGSSQWHGGRSGSGSRNGGSQRGQGGHAQSAVGREWERGRRAGGG